MPLPTKFYANEPLLNLPKMLPLPNINQSI
jgi:hypothetical protein